MKKLITIILLLSSLCVLLCACSGYEKGETFSENFLKSVSLDNMPLPESENYSLNNKISGQETLKFEIGPISFDKYVQSFVEYMKNRNDIYYFGIEDHEGLIAEMFPHQVTYKIDDEFIVDGKYFTFSYSLTNDLDYSSSCEHIKYEKKITVTIEYVKDEKFAYICIDKTGTFGSKCIDDSILFPDENNQSANPSMTSTPEYQK